MEKKFIGAGLVSGLIAGICAYIFARVYIEPQVAKAIDYEDGRSHAEEMLSGEHGHEHELFTRSVQENIGAATGTLIFALAMGAFFAVAFTVLWAYVGRHFPESDPRWVAAALGVIGFVAVYGVPFFAYPANPPAVGDSDTIGDRSSSYLIMVLFSVAFMIVAVIGYFYLRPRAGGLVSAIVAAIGYLIAVGITIAVMPEFHEIPTPLENPSGQIVFPGFPADVVGLFRIYSITNQIILWTVLTVAFALILGWMMKRESAPAAPTEEKVDA